jgi:hypothetical protein
MLYVIEFVGVRVNGIVVAIADIERLLLVVLDHIEDTLTVGVKGLLVGIVDTDLVKDTDTVKVVHELTVRV